MAWDQAFNLQTVKVASKFAIKIEFLIGKSDSQRFIFATDLPTAWVARLSSSFRIASCGCF